MNAIRFLSFAAALSLVFLAGCISPKSTADQIEQLKNRTSSLEEQIRALKQANANLQTEVEALQAAQQIRQIPNAPHGIEPPPQPKGAPRLTPLAPQ